MTERAPAVVPGPYLVPFDGSFDTADAPTAPPDDAPTKKRAKKRLEASVARIAKLQRILHAHDRHALLVIFQALDAGGKDSTIRAVLRGVNPAGCRVHSFKAPSAQELEHDFLWRTTARLPERGMIGVFNRSYYEEVLVVRVHPELLAAQDLPHVDPETVWTDRYRSIRDHEAHLARNGTVILKFFLNVSRDEQRRRFLSRLDEPHKHWKFEASDVRERGHWQAYMRAYEDALRATSRADAPWYAIPADDKPFMRMTVAGIIADRLERLDLRYPEPNEAAARRFGELRALLDED